MRQAFFLFTLLCLLGSGLANAAEVIERFQVEPVFGTKIRIVEAGLDKPLTLILLHGVGPEGATIWDDFIPEIALEYHVVACDLPGFGQSDKPNLLYSPERYSAFLDWLVNQTTTDRYILVGHSLGGALALHYTATAPLKPEQLILIDAAGILHRATLTKFMTHLNVGEENAYVPDRPVSWINRFTGTMIEKLQGVPIHLDFVLNTAKLRKKILQSDPNKIAGLALIQTNFTALIERVETPTNLIWGRDDNVAPLRTGQLLAARLPQAELSVIPECGHTPMRQQPDLFRQSLWQALLTPPTPLPAPIVSLTDRVGSCRNQENASFSGHYRRIDINRCQKVQLVDVTTAALTVTGSEVTIERSRIAGPGIGLHSIRSRIKATALDIEANPPIQTDQSKFDFVGVHLKSSTEQLVVGEGKPSRLLFSVSRGISPQFNDSLHDVVSISKQRPFKPGNNR